MALAVSATQTLYVVDPVRDQILRCASGGRFTVFAGTGKRGFSGDGGRAISANLNLTPVSGITVAQDGTVYFSDSGNNRVRAVSRDGRISTVAGTGRTGGFVETSNVSATKVALNDPAGLTVGANGDIYVAAQDTVAISPNGSLRRFAGATSPKQRQTPLNQFSNSGGSLAFDARGDLFAANFPMLYERTSTGRIIDLGLFRSGGGDSGVLAATHMGTIVEAYEDGVFLRRGAKLFRKVSIGRLSVPLGSRQRGVPNSFSNIEGVAVAPNGAIYVDTNPFVTGVGTSVSAIVVVNSAGRVTPLWKS